MRINILFREIDKGKYSNTDNFVHFEVIIEKREVVLLTDQRILYLMKNDLFGGWQIEWTHQWKELLGISANDRGVAITLKSKEQKKGISGLFSSSKQSQKVILIPHNAHRELVTKLMISLKEKSST